ncbi:membrane protein [Clostridium carboxidivorans P7]|nr:membrane protein [Clostridium carboxidivorans P7]
MDMLDTFIKCVSIVYVVNLVLKHNLFIYHLKIKIKFLGLDIEVKSKEKSAPSSQD